MLPSTFTHQLFEGSMSYFYTFEPPKILFTKILVSKILFLQKLFTKYFSQNTFLQKTFPQILFPISQSAFPPKLEWLEEQGSPLWRRADIVIILTGSTFRNTLYTLYIVHCTLYNVLYTLLHYTLYILLYTNWNTLIH